MNLHEINKALESRDPEQIRLVEEHVQRIADRIARMPIDRFDEAEIIFYDQMVKDLRKRIAHAREA